MVVPFSSELIVDFKSQLGRDDSWCRQTFRFYGLALTVLVSLLVLRSFTAGDHRDRLSLKDDVPGRPNSRKP